MNTAGRHHLNIPGPTQVPQRVLGAMASPTIDHRSDEFAALTTSVISRLKAVLGTDDAIAIFPSSGTGAWEAALVNTLSHGDGVLMYETGHFSGLWADMAKALGLDVEYIEGDWRTGVKPDTIAARLRREPDRFKAVALVHNETSTGVRSDIGAIRGVLDELEHPALLLVDTISSLGSMDYRHDEWRVDVTIAGSQKGLMLPPGLGFNVIGQRALQRAGMSGLPRAYWDWEQVIEASETGQFPYTPSTNHMYGLSVALDQLLGEGLPSVFARHNRHAEATRRAMDRWGLELVPELPAEYSSSLTAALVPDGVSADGLRQVVLEKFNLSLGAGLGRFTDRIVRVGHLGDLNDLSLMAALSGIEGGLRILGADFGPGGVTAAIEYLSDVS